MSAAEMGPAGRAADYRTAIAELRGLTGISRFRQRWYGKRHHG